MSNFARENIGAEAIQWYPTAQPNVAPNGYMWWDNNGTLFIFVNGKAVAVGSSASSNASTALNVQSAPFNAKGNGLTIVGVTTVNGSKTLIVASPFFTPSMAGQSLLVQGGGTNGVDLWTTIASFVSSTQVTMATAAGITLTSSFFNSVFVGGTDDTAAIQAAINAAGAAMPGPVGVYIPAGTYIISSTLTFPTPLPPAFVKGDGPGSTNFLRSQAFAASSSPLVDWEAGENSCDVSGISFYGASLAIGGTPTVGVEAKLIDFGTCTLSQLACFGSKFTVGLQMRMTNGTILQTFDYFQSNVALDNAVMQGCQAGSYFMPVDGLGGQMQNCVAAGYNDASSPRTDAAFEYDGSGHGSAVILPALISCVAAQNPGLTAGFKVSGESGYPITLAHCIAESFTGTNPGFLTGGDVLLISCTGNGTNALDVNNTGGNLQLVDCNFKTITSAASPVIQTGLTTALSAKNIWALSANNGVSVFRIDYYLVCTTAGSSGNIIPNFAWTDENGAQTANGTSLPAGAQGNVSGSLVVRAAASSNITLATTFSSVVGTPHYNVFATTSKVI